MDDEDSKGQILNAISSAKTEIEAHIDQVTVADVQACARSAISDLADINAMSQVTLQAFARDATNCAEQAVAQLGAVSSGAPVDELGFVLNTIAPIALFARTDAGFTVATIRQPMTPPPLAHPSATREAGSADERSRWGAERTVSARAEEQSAP